MHNASCISQINLSNGSVQRVITILLDRDLIYVNSAGIYRLVDPCLEQYLLTLAVE